MSDQLPPSRTQAADFPPPDEVLLSGESKGGPFFRDLETPNPLCLPGFSFPGRGAQEVGGRE